MDQPPPEHEPNLYVGYFSNYAELCQHIVDTLGIPELMGNAWRALPEFMVRYVEFDIIGYIDDQVTDGGMQIEASDEGGYYILWRR